MLTKLEEEIVSKYVDEYIDGLRMDVVMLDGRRVITEQSDSRIVIVDKDFLIDKSREYEVVLRNPVEDYFFIPQEIDYYETQIDLVFDRKDGFKITNFIDAGVIDSYSVPIYDPSITDNCLRNLMNWMCFDLKYQELVPEVKTVIDLFFAKNSSPEYEAIKIRIGPFIGINGRN
jgi:hypothetical protein